MWFETKPASQRGFSRGMLSDLRNWSGSSHRQKGQKYQGEPTRIEWLADRIVLPTIEGSQASGVVISCSGMKGRISVAKTMRGRMGRSQRPQLVLVDDPQTTESAWSAIQCERREAIVGSDILGMAGPDKRIAGLMACTVIRPGDMADRILDRERSTTDWQGERDQALVCLPQKTKNSGIATPRSVGILSKTTGTALNDEFYRKHREAMDEGGRAPAWPERHFGNEISRDPTTRDESQDQKRSSLLFRVPKRTDWRHRRFGHDDGPTILPRKPTGTSRGNPCWGKLLDHLRRRPQTGALLDDQSRGRRISRDTWSTMVPTPIRQGRFSRWPT